MQYSLQITSNTQGYSQVTARISFVIQQLRIMTTLKKVTICSWTTFKWIKSFKIMV